MMKILFAVTLLACGTAAAQTQDDLPQKVQQLIEVSQQMGFQLDQAVHAMKCKNEVISAETHIIDLQTKFINAYLYHKSDSEMRALATKATIASEKLLTSECMKEQTK